MLDAFTRTYPVASPGNFLAAPVIGSQRRDRRWQGQHQDRVGGDGSAVVTFAAPTNDGGSPINTFTVISTPGNVTATRITSPITITGLTNGVSYTFRIQGPNPVGAGPRRPERRR